jgi:hypothetical protein
MSFRGQVESIRLAKYSLGPVKFLPSFSLSLQYDSNIYGAAIDRGPLSDYVATLAVPMRFYLVAGDWLIVSLVENPEYVYFFKRSSERSFNNNFSPHVSLLLLHRFVVSAAYLNTRAKQHVWSEFDTRVWQSTKGYTASLAYQTSRDTSIGFYWSAMRLTYESVSPPGAVAPLSQAWDREVRSGRIQFNRTVLANANLFLSFGRSDFRFLNSPTGFRDGSGYQVNAGIQFPVLGRARGLLSLGYSKFTPKAGGRRGFSGLVANTGLDFRLGRLSLRLTLRRDSPFAYGQTIFFIENWYGAGASFYISSRARLDYNFNYGGGTYPEPVIVTGPDGNPQEITQKDSYQNHSISLVFRLIRNTGLGLTVNYWRRGSNYYLFRTDRYYAGMFITYDF